MVSKFDYMQVDDKIISVVLLANPKKRGDDSLDSPSHGKSPRIISSTSSEDEDEQLLSIEQNCLNISVYDTKTRNDSDSPRSSVGSNDSNKADEIVRSINLPWYGPSMGKY